MEQCRNRFILVSAVCDDEACNRQQMCDVGNLSTFAVLSRMEPSGER
jgi:hypothetical protein